MACPRAKPLPTPASACDLAVCLSCGPITRWMRGGGPSRIRHAFIPKGACWLNLQEGWWRIFRRQALAGQAFADPYEIAHGTQVATAQLNARARP